VGADRGRSTATVPRVARGGAAIVEPGDAERKIAADYCDRPAGAGGGAAPPRAASIEATRQLRLRAGTPDARGYHGLTQSPARAGGVTGPDNFLRHGDRFNLPVHERHPTSHQQPM